MDGVDPARLHAGVWLRSPTRAQKDAPLTSYVPITGSEGNHEYRLGVDDVDCYINFRVTDGKHKFAGSSSSSSTEGSRHTPTDPSTSPSSSTEAESEDSGLSYAFAPIGPVTSGPPRLLELTIGGTLVAGGKAIATSQYIGE